MQRVRIVLALCLVLIVSSCSSTEQGNSVVGAGRTRSKGIASAEIYQALTGSVIPDYEQVAETSNLRLYMNAENLAVIVESIETGERLDSIVNDSVEAMNKNWQGFMTSGFALEYYNERTPTAFRVDAVNGTPIITTENVDGGFEAEVVYEELGLSFVMQTRLTDTGLSVFVPSDSITETGTASISGLYIYPFMGASHLGNREGYMLIPEGSGALISLEDHHGLYKSPYSKRIYGDNTGTKRLTVDTSGTWDPKESTQILAPFYGIVHTDRSLAMLATVEQGQYNAEFLAYPNGVITEYNWATVRFIFREQYSMQTTRDKGILSTETNGYFRDVRVDYHVLEGEQANYSGMARLYRDIVKSGGGLAECDTNYKTRLDFMGADAEEWLISYKATVATTLADMDRITDDLIGAGVEHPLLVLKGWQSGGITYNYGSGDISLEGALGSKRQLTNLADKITEAGGRFMLYQDLMMANPERSLNANKNIAKGIGQTIINNRTSAYPFGNLYYITPIWAQSIAGKLQKAFSGNESIDFAIGSATNTLFSYYTQNTVHSRGEAGDGFSDAIAALEQTVALEQPFDFYWQYADVMLDMPLYSSNYNFISAEIPFIPMVLYGSIPYYSDYINFSPNENEFRLKMAEYGAYPSFIITQENPLTLRDTNSSYIYSSEYDVWKEKILWYDQEMKQLYDQLSGATMEQHTILQKNVVRVDYSNGMSLFVNYSTSAYTDGTVIVPSQNYMLIQFESTDSEKGV